MVPWNKQQEAGLQTEAFILLLHKMGFHLAADVGKCFPRIPHFWSVDHIYQLALKLGPIKQETLKMDLAASVENMSASGGQNQITSMDGADTAMASGDEQTVVTTAPVEITAVSITAAIAMETPISSSASSSTVMSMDPGGMMESPFGINPVVSRRSPGEIPTFPAVTVSPASIAMESPPSVFTCSAPAPTTVMSVDPGGLMASPFGLNPVVPPPQEMPIDSLLCDPSGMKPTFAV